MLSRAPGASRTLGSTLVAASALFLLAVTVTFGATQPDWFASDPSTGGAFADYDLAQIVTRNGAAVLLVYSGAITFGVMSVVSTLAIGAFVGATAKVGVSSVGWAALLGASGLYAPIEFAAIVVACAAGLLPAATVVRRRASAGPTSEAGLLAAYAQGLRRSLGLLACSGGLLLIAALIESFLISRR